MCGKSSSSSLVSIPNEVRTDLWLSSTSDAERSVRLYVGFPRSELSKKILLFWSYAGRSVTHLTTRNFKTEFIY